MKSLITKFQIGKNGINSGVIESLALAFKNRKQIRVSVLKSSGRDRITIREMALQLQQQLPFHVECKIIGFTIILFKKSSSKHKKIS